MTRKLRTPARESSACSAAVGRADLVRAYAAGGEDGLRAMVGLLGYRAQRNTRKPERAEEGLALDRVPAPDEAAASWAPIPFWRLCEIEHREPPPEIPPPVADQGPLGIEGLRREPGRRPQAAPLAPAAHLWPPLWPRLTSAVPSRSVDVAALVERWGRGQPVRRIPFRSVAAWSPRVTVLVDRSRRLVPFWQDQDWLLGVLRRRLGRTAIREVVFREGFPFPWQERRHWHAVPPVEPEVPVLALSDLGFFAGFEERAIWAGLGRRLQRERIRRAALVPVPAGRWSGGLAGLWSAVDWERPPRTHRAGRSLDPAGLAERARRLLGLLSFATRVEPGLLRTVRRLLPAAEADAGTEADAWALPALDGSFSPAATLSADERAGLRRRFAGEPEEVKRGVVASMRAWRAGLPEEIWLDEVLSLATVAGLPGDALTPDEIARARRLPRRLAATAAAQARVPAQVVKAVQGFALRFLDRQPAELWADPELRPLLRQVREVFWDGPGEPPLPAGVGPEVLEGADRPPGRWWAVQVAGGLRFLPASPTVSGGSLVAEMVSANGRLKVETGARLERPRPLEAAQPIPLPAAARITLRTDRSVAVLERLTRPGWATAIGRDRFGLWASFEIQGVVQRMRWIPPGRFWMGSPEEETGRWEDEGPRHEVAIRRGFWLGDTPCTQALWEAVRGENPSRFRTPDRPVEQVSWEDCQDFCSALEEQVPGLGARLPSEAEWEYACRSGTGNATYAGPIELRGTHDAPVLDAIAWYGGNSGQGFDLENGVDSSDWPEKQYPHTRAGTHPVAAKAANPWGLYDMLGNVYEWCADPWRSDYASEAQGSSRVFRGGSWVSIARGVRAACRGFARPSYRWLILGFRLARGQGAGAEPPAGQSARGGARRGTRRRSRGAGPEGGGR